jgi:hypothetical protein
MMSRLIVLLMLLVPVFVLAGEEETLVRGPIQSGGYGGPVLKIGPILDDTGVFVGGVGGWVINSTFVLGGGGFGLVNNVPAPVSIRTTEDFIPDGDDWVLNFGYGGVFLEYIVRSKKMMHTSVHTLIGGGGVGYRRKNWDENADELGTESFFVLEPGANVMVNVTSFFRIGVGGTYRFITGVDSDWIEDADLRGASAQIVFKFGSF